MSNETLIEKIQHAAVREMGCAAGVEDAVREGRDALVAQVEHAQAVAAVVRLARGLVLHAGVHGEAPAPPEPAAVDAAPPVHAAVAPAAPEGPVHCCADREGADVPCQIHHARPGEPCLVTRDQCLGCYGRGAHTHGQPAPVHVGPAYDGEAALVEALNRPDPLAEVLEIAAEGRFQTTEAPRAPEPEGREATAVASPPELEPVEAAPAPEEPPPVLRPTLTVEAPSLLARAHASGALPPRPAEEDADDAEPPPSSARVVERLAPMPPRRPQPTARPAPQRPVHVTRAKSVVSSPRPDPPVPSDAASIPLTENQWTELQRLFVQPQSTFGSFRCIVQRILVDLKLAVIEGRGEAERCRITEGGRIRHRAGRNGAPVETSP